MTVLDPNILNPFTLLDPSIASTLCLLLTIASISLSFVLSWYILGYIDSLDLDTF
jgi:hypothetical protein